MRIWIVRYSNIADMDNYSSTETYYTTEAKAVEKVKNYLLDTKYDSVNYCGIERQSWYLNRENKLSVIITLREVEAE